MELRLFYIVLALLFTSSVANAQSKPRLAVNLNGSELSFKIDPVTNGTSCSFRIVGSFAGRAFLRDASQRKALTPRVERSTNFQLLGTIPGDIRSARASSGRRSLFLAVGERCNGAESFSKVKRLRVSASQSGQRDAQWIRNTRQSVAVGLLSLTDVFPALNFSFPIDMQREPGTGRLHVVEQGGVIARFDDDATATTTFLDLSSLVRFEGEQGLLGMAFHPEYATNGYVFVNYTEAATGDNVLSRYTRDSGNSDQLDPTSALEILRTEQPFENHKGGQIRFGPDGYLYIALGDGGSGGDPLGNGQNLQSLLGKLLRLDVDSVTSPNNYSIPASNPFVGVAGAREEIYAYGLRNPWRFSFDSATDLLYAADVGQNRLEEINIISSGGNYGWNVMEGSECYPLGSTCSSNDYELPLAEYRRPLGYSVTGGFVYRGVALAERVGDYFFADFTTGRIFHLDDQEPSTVLEAFDTQISISAFGEDEDGELYVLSYFDGKVLKLVDNSSSS